MLRSWILILSSLVASLGVHVEALQFDADFSTPSKANESIQHLLHTLDAPANYVDTITSVWVSGSEELGNWTLLGDVFSRLHKLEQLHWSANAGIPATILSHLETKNPACRLYYEIRSMFVSQHSQRIQDQITIWNYDNSTEISRLERMEQERWHRDRETVLGSENLYELKAVIVYASEPNYEDLELVFDILASCPNLRILDLRIRYDGDNFGGRTPDAFDFLSKPGVKFPPLEILRISGYDFNERSDGGRAWDWRNVSSDWEYENWHSDDPLPPPARRESDGRSQLDCWKEAMDWSHLHTLDIALRSTEVLRGLRKDVVPNLKDLSLEIVYPLAKDWGNDVLEFIGGTRLPLVALSLKIRVHDRKPLPRNQLVDAIVSLHGSRLESLSLLTETDENSSLLDSIQIQGLLHGCLKLHTLDISLPRPAIGDTIDQLQDLASTPTLKSITLRFSSPDFDLDSTEYREKLNLYFAKGAAEDEIDPIINKTLVTRMFEDLRSRRKAYLESLSRTGMSSTTVVPHGQEELHMNIESLKIYVGNWDGRKDQVMLPNFRRVAFWECRVTEGEDPTCEGRQVRGSL